MSNNYKVTSIIPTTADEVKKLRWDSIDVILFSGDAYIDHPSFGAAIIARVLEKEGLKVAVVPQPNWRDDLRDFKKLGKPNLFFAVTSGNMDSMVNHYTANKRLRSDDAYTPGGRAGYRPDYAVTVYCRILKDIFPEVPILIGGIEASLRRFTHYDYWSDSLKPSILMDSGATLLIYGMAEKPLKELVKLIKSGYSLDSIHHLPQSAYVINDQKLLPELIAKTIYLNSYEECLKSKKAYADNFCIIEGESNKNQAARIIEPCNNQWVVVNPPYENLTQEEIDEPYALPYTRLPHPRYQNKPPIPAFEMIKNSVNIHRGCFGGCSFCTISAHQGKFIQSRSIESIMEEVKAITSMPYFNGTISDLGGPSANMFRMEGINQEICDHCKRPSCIFPQICNNLNADHSSLNELYNMVRNIDGVKHVFIGSGIRYDLLYQSQKHVFINKAADEYLDNLVNYHVSGRLKVAPEHCSQKVLKLMRKPSFEVFKNFVDDFEKRCRRYQRSYQIIPYFISSHPGCGIQEMAELAIETKNLNFKLEQVQDFTPTPLTLSTCIYYTGVNPYTGEKIYTAKTLEDKKNQNSFFFWYQPEKRQLITSLLRQAGKSEYINKLITLHSGNYKRNFRK
jgi:uncharacterized radical SAM protein YgiQ